MDQGSDTNGVPLGREGDEVHVEEPVGDAQGPDGLQLEVEGSDHPDVPMAEEGAETVELQDAVTIPRAEWVALKAEIDRLTALSREHENFRVLFEERLCLVQARVDLLTRREAGMPGQQQSGSRPPLSIPPPKILEVNGDPYAWVGDIEAYFRYMEIADANMVSFVLTRMSHAVRQSWLNSAEHATKFLVLIDCVPACFGMCCMYKRYLYLLDLILVSSSQYCMY